MSIKTKSAIILALAALSGLASAAAPKAEGGELAAYRSQQQLRANFAACFAIASELKEQLDLPGCVAQLEVAFAAHPLHLSPKGFEAAVEQSYGDTIVLQPAVVSRVDTRDAEPGKPARTMVYVRFDGEKKDVGGQYEFDEKRFSPGEPVMGNMFTGRDGTTRLYLRQAK